MTTIVYHNEVLASDSSAVTGGTITYIKEGIKTRISACKRFAYGISGIMLDPEWLAIFELKMFAFLVEYRSAPPSKMPIPKDMKELLDGRDFLIMTKDATYARFETKRLAMTITKLLPDEHAAIGTGRIIANMAILAGHTAEQAVEFAIAEEFFTYPSKILVINRSQLKAFPKEIAA